MPTQFGIGHAIESLRLGRKITRAGWNGNGMYLALKQPAKASDMTLPYIYMYTAQGALVPWLASQTDILSDDYYELTE